jgi:hypothetical protein
VSYGFESNNSVQNRSPLFSLLRLGQGSESDLPAKPEKWAAPLKKACVGSCSLDFSILRMKAFNSAWHGLTATKAWELFLSEENSRAN